MRLAWIKIALFVMVVASPLLALAGFGAVAAYGQRPHPEYPALHNILDGSPGMLDKLGEALLHRSAITLAAIQLKNWIAYDLVGFVDTDQVISGSDGWLFYKPSLLIGGCLKENVARRLLAQIDVMTDLAKVSGLELIVSVSPDKAAIYADRLHPLAKAYWRCKPASSALWRRLMKSEAPRILDHGEAMVAERIRRPDIELFLHTDTHWTPYGAALALRQLLGTVFRLDHRTLPPPRLLSEPDERQTGLRNGMLLLPELERFADIDASVESDLPRLGDRDGRRRIVVLRDSFYALIDEELKQLMGGAEIFALDADPPVYRSAAEAADLIVVNSVERSFLQRIAKGPLSWDSVLGQVLLARNARAADGCTEFRTIAPTDEADRGTKLRNVAVDAHGWHVTGADPRIVTPIGTASASRPPCLRLSVDVPKPAKLELFLPQSTTELPQYAAGRSIVQALSAGPQTLTFVLPLSLSGLPIRIDPGSGPEAPIDIRSIELGMGLAS